MEPPTKNSKLNIENHKRNYVTRNLLPGILLAFLLVITTNSYAQTPSIPGTGTSAAICGTCAPVGWQDIGGTPDISDRNTAGGGNTLGAGATWVNAPLPLPPTGDVRWITMRDVGDFNTQADESVTSTITGLLAGKLYELRVYVMSSFTNADGGTGNNEYYGGSHVDSFGYQIGSNPRVDINIDDPIYQDQWREITIVFVASNGTAQNPGTETITIFPNDDAITNGSAQNFEIIHFAVDDVNAIEILDTDGDGIDDFVDIDDDNDGILDINEYGISTNPNLDDDADGVPNYLDLDFTGGVDSNNDGIPDNSDFDLDGVPNHLDLDSDNDGILDNVEAQATAGYIAPSGTGTGITDIDMDGLDDNYDSDTASVTTTDSVGITAVNSDTDASGLTLPDFLDIDSDNDGIPDNVEAQGTLTYVTSPYVSTVDIGEVGDNGVYSVYENVDTYAAIGLTPQDTDLDNTPDYRDSDSDNDGTTDINESGRGNTLSGNDADGDGLDDNLDTQSGPDPNDNITDPATDLQENPLDNDVNSGGDVDYRDGVTGLDSDGDGIPDTVDIDDDNDGILDINECVSTTIPAGGPNAITIDNNVNRETEILDGLTGGQQGARMNSTNDLLVLQLRANDAVVPAGTTITITTTASNTAAKRLLFQQSDAAGTVISGSINWNVSYNSGTSGDQNFTGSGNTIFNVVFVLPVDATHIRISMTERAGGRINMDHLEYASFTNCDPGDTDGDGIIDSLDIDSDNDGITDNYESQTTAGYIAPTGLDDDNDGLDNAYDSNDSDTSTGASIGIINPVNTDGSLTNSDTIPDYLDIDSDNDGIPDNVEAQSTTGYVAPNGVPGANGLDSAYDFNDSFTNTGLSTTLINTDGDTEPDYRDTNSDGDATNDDAEGLTGSPTWIGTDTDGDGLDDGYEGSNNNDGFDVNDEITDPETGGLIDVDTDVTTGGDVDYRDTLVGQDTDGDGIVDSVDIDDDNDGILDTVEGEVADFDGDGIPNSLDQDSDGDGILDIVESQGSTGANTLSGSDQDGDGLDDNFDATPNGNSDGTGSIGTASPVNTDGSLTNSDTNPDYLDIDSDNDGIPDNVEAQTTQGYTAPSGNVGLNGVDSAYENNDTFTATGLNPNNNDNTDEPDYRDLDSDNDAINDENENGITPNGGTTDSDGDGLLDTWEGSDATAGEAYDVNDEINDPENNLLDADNDAGTTGDVDYRDDNIFIDSDGDEIQDSIDLDDDNDGILDTVESGGIDPSADADGDGTPNYLDSDNNGGGTLGDANMDGVQDIFDADNDGVANHLDIDSDDDGIPDNIEAQSTLGYIAPSGTGTGITDVNMDGVDDNYAGGLTPIDTDTIIGNNGDGIPDYLDTDSDNDLILDINENGNANSLSGTDTDGDGYDDAFEGVINDQDVNDDVDNPATDLPDEDSDVNTPYTDMGNGFEDFNDVDFRDTDDDRVLNITPGHVLWLRGDIGLSEGAWEDQTGSVAGGDKYDATGINSPLVNSSGVNFNPTAVLNGTNQNFQITNGIFGNTSSGAYSSLWIYAVGSRTSGTADAYLFSHNVDGANVASLIAPDGANLSFTPGVGGNTLTTAYGSSNGTFNIWNAGFDNASATPSGSTTTLYRDGLQLATNTTTGTFDGDNGDAFIGSLNGGTFMAGEIAEIMVYTSVPTSARQQQIQSYLAIKYGITLSTADNDATIIEGDYVLEDLSTIVWDESENSAYHNDVAGIGRDDGMFLNQKQSRSIETDAIVTIGLGNGNSIATDNASNSNSFSGDKNFLMWGNNGVAVNNTNTSSVTLLCESELQLDRVWKIVETGSVGTVEVAVPQLTIDAALTSPSTHVTLLKVADDANFTTNVKHIPVTEREIFGDGTQYYTANFDFNGTKYFTFTEVLGIFWNGDTATWRGGAGVNGAPSDGLSSDNLKVLVIDSETSQTNAFLDPSRSPNPDTDATVECVWVKPNSKLVIGSNLSLTFSQDFVLEGEIRMVDDAQLVQTHAGLSNVQGNGVIYRDQASNTPSVYRYNYWSSPVVAALGNTSYTTSTVMFDGTTPTSENSTVKAINWQDYDGSVSSLNSAPTDPITIATWWIYSYFNGVDRGDWVQQRSTGAINIGEGFIMKSTGRAPQNFTFMGSPNDGTITKVLTPNTNSLVGNPYPSVIDTQVFISDNSNVIDGTLYFWEHQGESSTTTAVEGHTEFGYIGGYSQRNSAMGVAANSVTDETAGLGEGTYTSPPQYIAVGQGFFVGATNGGTLTFQNTQRIDNTNNVFFRSRENNNENLPNFKIGMDYINGTNARIHRQLGINFKEGNTFAYESGFDSNTFDLQENDMYWDFEELNRNLVIAGVGSISTELQVPLGFVMDIGQTVTVSIDEKENMDGYTIYLVDLVTGRFFDMDNPIELNLLKGTYSGRFVITFAGTALSNNDNPLLQEFNVFMDNTAREIVIRNNNNTSIKSVELYNILGQNVKQWKDISNSNLERLEVNQPSGVYIVRVNTDNGKITKKVIIE